MEIEPQMIHIEKDLVPLPITQSSDQRAGQLSVNNLWKKIIIQMFNCIQTKTSQSLDVHHDLIDHLTALVNLFQVNLSLSEEGEQCNI